MERLGGPPAFRDSAAPETIMLLNDHALQDWRDVAERVARPVLMIAGRGSQIWPCEHAEAAITANPLGRAVIIEDSGHTVSLTNPTALTKYCWSFCAKPVGSERLRHKLRFRRTVKRRPRLCGRLCAAGRPER
jgi:pimeloyl-ACP methyl ester carboxylesterase